MSEQLKFNPADYASIGEMPEEQKDNFKPAIDGRGFVRESAIDDIDKAHEMAIEENDLREGRVVGHYLSSGSEFFGSLLESLSDKAAGYLKNVAKLNGAVAIDPNTIVAKSERSEWGSSGGIGYFDQVRAYYHGQTAMSEYQWRDRWSASNDRPHMAVHGLADAKLEVKDGQATLTVTLVNGTYGNRTAEFKFDAVVEEQPTISLTEEEKAEFIEKVEASIQAILSELEKNWEFKPLMWPSGPVYTESGMVSYDRPRIKEKIIRPDLGVAVFVTEEQIDHRVSDKQMRYELYIVTSESATPLLAYESHGYDSEGGAVVGIQDISEKDISLNTANGPKIIKFRK